jgi:hypothetical protein
MKIKDAEVALDNYFDNHLASWGIPKTSVCVSFKSVDADAAKFEVLDYATGIDLDVDKIQNEAEMLAWLERGLIYHLTATPFQKYRRAIHDHYGVSQDKEAVFESALKSAITGLEVSLTGLRGSDSPAVAILSPKAKSTTPTPMVGKLFTPAAGKPTPR